MDDSTIWELAGIGIGPFNLGLAALCYTIGMRAIFFDQSTVFNWYPGLLIKDARLQVPFFADLVTPVDPCSRFSYMAYLHNTERLFRFAIRDNHFIKRTEYNNYCKWVIKQLPHLYFEQTCENITYDEKRQCYIVSAGSKKHYAKNIVIGIGSKPHMPSISQDPDKIFTIHSGDYLNNKVRLLQQKQITIVGSGQSAAEIIFDLLQSSYQGTIDWFTRSDGFFPMDYSKFTLEKTSLDYIDYFYRLPRGAKAGVLSRQNNVYKGINETLLSDIYNLLDDDNIATVKLHPNCELIGIENGPAMRFIHTDYQQTFTQHADAVILATGYKPAHAKFVEGIHHLIDWDDDGKFLVNRNYSVDRRNSIFVQNAEAHTHGHNSADLGLGAYRNATILNTLLGWQRFNLETNIAFQQFGPKLNQAG